MKLVEKPEVVLSASQLYGQGLIFLDEKKPKEAHRYFRRALDAGPSIDLMPLVQSYLGYTLVVVAGQDLSGIRLMNEAIAQDSYRPEFFMNLSRAYAHQKNRRNAVRALRTGLKHCPTDPFLRQALEEIGVRKKPILPFLPRASLLNRWLGQKIRASR